MNVVLVIFLLLLDTSHQAFCWFLLLVGQTILHTLQHYSLHQYHIWQRYQLFHTKLLLLFDSPRWCIHFHIPLHIFHILDLHYQDYLLWFKLFFLPLRYTILNQFIFLIIKTSYIHFTVYTFFILLYLTSIVYLISIFSLLNKSQLILCINWS